MTWPINRAPDGLPLLYSMPHEPDCPCVHCLIRADLVDAMAHYFDAWTSDYERSLSSDDPEDT